MGRWVILALAVGAMVASGGVAAAGDPDGEGTEQVRDRETPPAISPPEPPPLDPVAPVRPEKVRRTAIYGIVGLGTPVGVIGLEAVHRFGSIWEVAAGVGEGESASASETSPSIGHVLQWSVMPRIRLATDHNAFTIGMGVSGGQYGGIQAFATGPGCHSDGYPCGGFPTRYVLWGNVEIGGEHWLGHCPGAC